MGYFATNGVISLHDATKKWCLDTTLPLLDFAGQLKRLLSPQKRGIPAKRLFLSKPLPLQYPSLVRHKVPKFCSMLRYRL